MRWEQMCCTFSLNSFSIMRWTDVSVLMRLKAWCTQQAAPVLSLLVALSQWEQNEIKHCPAKSTVVACDGHRVHILSWASSTNEHQLKGWLVHFWKFWGCKVRWRLQWQREGWVYQVSGNRKCLFSLYSQTWCPYLFIIPSSFASAVTQRRDCWGR